MSALSYSTALFGNDEFFNRFRFALFREGTMPINYRKIHDFRQKMDKYRYKDERYKYYLKMVMGTPEGANQCDIQCAKKCFSDSLGTAWFIFSSCLIPQCNCALHPLPQSILFTADPKDAEIIKDSDTMDDAEDEETQVDENGEEFTAVISMQSETGEYNLYRDCNLLCHKDCLSIRKNVPFEVLEVCV